jgi:hypothetical protein
VPVRITEGAYRDLAADHEKDMEPDTLRLVRAVLREHDAYGRPRGFTTAELAHQMALYLHPMAEPGRDELVAAERDWKRTLENAHGNKWRDEVATSVIDMHGRQATLKWHLPTAQPDAPNDLMSQD